MLYQTNSIVSLNIKLQEITNQKYENYGYLSAQMDVLNGIHFSYYIYKRYDKTNTNLLIDFHQLFKLISKIQTYENLKQLCLLEKKTQLKITVKYIISGLPQITVTDGYQFILTHYGSLIIASRYNSPLCQKVLICYTLFPFLFIYLKQKVRIKKVEVRLQINEQS